MKLSLRINYILLPVILAIFSAAGLYAYSNQRDLIVSAAAEKMKYTGQYTILDIHKNMQELLSLTEVFLNSSELIRYLNNDVTQQSSLVLESHFIRYLGQFRLSYGQFEKVSLLDGNNDFVFHYDVTDPFSRPQLDKDIINHQAAVARQLKATGSTYLNPASYLVRKEANDKITLLVFRTFSPQHLIADNTFSGSMKFVTAIAETTIDLTKRYKQPLQVSFGKGVTIDIEPVDRVMQLSESMLSNEVLEEGSHLVVRTASTLVKLEISLAKNYLHNLLTPYKQAIFSLIFGISMLTFFILKLLIQKQIISPVISLTKQVQNARNGQETALKRIDKKDEIALLNNNYVLLFDDLNKMAQSDSLTGLSNRSMFDKTLKRVIYHSAKNQTRSALLYIDLDNFKYVNDNYGHDVGDSLLKAFSQRLKVIFTPENLTEFEIRDSELARLAGDEFAVLLVDIPHNEVVVSLAQKITELCSLGFSINEQYFDIKVSVGVAIYPDDAAEPETLLKNADSAMYQVKNFGKNGYQFYSQALAEQMNLHKKIESALKQALLDQSFYLVWMPTYDCKNGKVTGAEALLRSESTVLANIGPAEFIPVAEMTGLIKDIDYWVIESCIIKLKELIDKYHYTGVLAANFSAWELKNQSFSEDIGNLIEKYQIPPAQLVLEITETCLVSSEVNAKVVLNELKQLGIKLALDDFGTGYTAFNQLADYPVDILKVDRTFTNSIFESTTVNNKPLIDIIVELGFLYSLDVIAEGVETKEQLDYVRRLGCDRAQGFYMSKPISWQDFVQLMTERDSRQLILDNSESQLRLEFKSSTASVQIITSAQIVRILYKGSANYELLDFILRSIPSCISHLHDGRWGVVILADDEYELTNATENKIGELLKYCFMRGCVDGAYVVSKPETKKQLIEIRRSLGFADNFDQKNFATLAEAESYIHRQIEMNGHDEASS
ncbi:EAL domain-containing protein [Vibrio sp. TH_r3]|uniref:putative bifunctional diguanylate cyclase/phosphodiesterase n=1 Tax=Vibrio sp. TH_r3 TaxID=3082084 RepID=UPI0029546BD1|nr:EAL domain-containing protein [Vibrio sp. TH_r3]MDV7104666.1 EAL domain-containing protein [Vibrio sp. TH_r3]